MLRIVFVMIALCATALGLSTGPPGASCASMIPLGHMAAGFNSSDLGFSIKTETDIVAGRDTLQITVTGEKQIKGIFIQVRDASGDNIVGVFEAPNAVGFQLLDCLGVNGGAFGHSNSDDKGSSVTATWRAPDMCDGTYTIRSTVVTAFSTFQTGLRHQITCISLPTEPQTTIAPSTSEASTEEKTPPPITTAMSTTTTTMSPTTTTVPPTTTTIPPTTTTMPPTTATMPPSTATMPPTTTTMPPTTTTEPLVVKTMTTTTTTTETSTASSAIPETATTMTTSEMPSPRRPSMAGGVCMYSKFTVVPNKYRTSFEDNDLNGWINTEYRQRSQSWYNYPSYLRTKRRRRHASSGSTYYSHSFFYPKPRRPHTSNQIYSSTAAPSSRPYYTPYSTYTTTYSPPTTASTVRPSYSSKKTTGWKKNNGRTPSFGTGPSSAADGDYYMYLEATGRKPGDSVTLETRRDLRGCFCLHLKHHLNIRNYNSYSSRHRLSVKTSSKVLKSTSARSNKWEDMWVQVDTKRYTNLRIIGTRGLNYRGDIAIDNVYITPGECPSSGATQASAQKPTVVHSPSMSPSSRVYEASTTTAQSTTKDYSSTRVSNENISNAHNVMRSRSYTTAPPTTTSSIVSSASKYPIATKDVCVNSNYNNVQNKYHTSFEDNDLNGWINTEHRQKSQSLYNFYSYFQSKRRRRQASNYYSASFFYHKLSRPHTSNQIYSSTAAPSSRPYYTPYSRSTTTYSPPTTASTARPSYSSEKSTGWKRNKGETPSLGTGPSSAAEGDYYMYLEASDYRSGDSVTLQTRTELRGCLCLHLKYHLNVNNPVRKQSAYSYYYYSQRSHELSIRTQDKILKTISNASNEWTDLWVQIDTKRYTKLRIVGVRGANSRGDMAIDDVSIKPGKCPNDKS